MHLTFLLLSLLVVASYGHLTTIGSIGPGVNDPNFFKVDNISPCPVEITDSSRINVTAGEVFPVTWALVVNHNNPPHPVGGVHFRWAAGVPSTSSAFVEIAPFEPIVAQPAKYYFVQSVVIIPGDTSARGTLQVMYDVNGAPSPFPAYYQCINFFVAI